MSGRNRKLLYEVADVIEREPERYDQGTYITVKDQYPYHLMWAEESTRSRLVDEIGVEDIEWGCSFVPECDTVHCIAGHAIALAGWKFDLVTGKFALDGALVGDLAPVLAQNELGLESHETAVLFHQDWAPRDGLSVSDALRLIADGESVMDVTDEDFCGDY